MGNITYINFEDFEDFSTFMEFIKKNPRFESVYTRGDMDYLLSYHNVFDRVSKIWIMDGFVISLQNRGSSEIIINPELDGIIKRNSVNVIDTISNKTLKMVDNYNVVLDIDSILDRINQIGIDNLTKEEKDFLDKNNN